MSIQANFPNVQPSLLLDFANAKQLPPSVNFTRATTATYYDGSTTAMAEQNLLLYSQEFNQSAWTKTLGSITANADTAPDGTATADLFTPSDAASRVQQAFNPSAALPYVFTVYLRSATGSSFSTDLIAWRDSPFNQVAITTITVTTTWQRFTLAFTSLDTTAHSVVIGGGGSLSTGENLYMWGAQLEQRSSATAYTATTTQAITNYVPVLLTAGGGQPRFDHNPTTSESLGLLIEEQRTNAFQYSADLGTSPWAVSSVAVSGNTIIAPDGTLTGDKIIPDATNNVHYVRQIVGSSTNYTFSCYFKAAEHSTVVMLGVSANHGAAFDLANGTVSATYGSATATITAVGNGWYRCATAISVSGTDFYIYVGSAGTYVGNAFSGIYAWGAQLEAASFATSYIPTTSASATRADDLAIMTGVNFSSWHNPAEGVLYAEWRPYTLTPSVANGVFSLNNGGDNNVVQIFGSSVSGRTTFEIYSAGTSYVSASVSSVLTTTNFAKIAASYETNSAIQATNGQLSSADTTVVLLPGINRADIGTVNGGNYVGNGHYKKVAYYPQAATSAQLQALTS